MSTGRVQYCYDIITHEYNLQGKIQSWDVILEGTIVYNPNTGEIYSANNPRLDLYDISGVNSQLSPYFKGVSTGYNIMPSKVKFYATYDMEARLNGKIDGVDIDPPAILKFGTYTAQFYAYRD